MIGHWFAGCGGCCAPCNKLDPTRPFGAKSSALRLNAGPNLKQSECPLEELRFILTAKADIEGDGAVFCF
jgi:hypothetical protein